jgi:hypothetical protein
MILPMPAEAYHDALIEAFAAGGCPVCALTERAVDRYVDSVLWDMVNDPPMRARLVETRGFCRAHAWRFARKGAALGVAIMMQDLVGNFLRELDGDAAQADRQGWRGLFSGEGAAARLEDALQPQRPCLVCAYIAPLEADMLASLAKHMTGRHGFAQAYAASDGLCLPHFRGALAAAGGKQRAALVDAQRQVWQRLHGELAEFIRKNDYRFRSEGFGGEADSWERALEAVSGSRPPQGTDKGLTQAL